MGVVGGVILVMSWWRFGSVMACVVVVGLILGFLVASTVLFTPLGRENNKCLSQSTIILYDFRVDGVILIRIHMLM